VSTDYERYIRTDELLSLQKPVGQQVNHDELLFQVTHQSSELWMKAVLQDLSEAVRLLHVAAGASLPFVAPASAQSNRYPPLDRAVYLLRRSARIVEFLAKQVRVLELMAPADYHQIRLALGRGSGGELHDLIQALLEVDEQFNRFRQSHLSLVRREIGLDVLSLKGMPAQKLVAGSQAVMFKELWDAISALTNTLNASYGG